MRTLPSILMGVVSIIHWVVFEKGTAFEGPGLDMVVFFERSLDPNFISGDFLTNANQISNPRMIFGYGIVWISKLLGISWYSTFFFLKMFFVVAIPTLWMEFIASCCFRLLPSNHFCLKKVYWLAFIFVLLALIDHIPHVNDLGFLSVRGLFVIAWWPPIFTSTGPQTLAILFGLGAALRAADPKNKGKIFNPYLIIATFIHPTVAIMGYLILILVLASSSSFGAWKDVKQKIMELVVNWVLPCFIILMFYRSAYPLNSDIFAYIYAIQGHPHHYWVKEMASFSRFSWRFAFSNVLMACVLIYFLAERHKCRSIKRLAIFFIIFYVGILLAQYLVIEVIPVKAIISFSPIRLSMISYWVLSILIISSICSRGKNGYR
jgi:hypothetical protein